MKKYLFIFSFFLSACTSTADNASQISSTNQCATRFTKTLNGQIRYLEGMILKINGCKIYYSSDFDFKTEGSIGKVIDKIDYGSRTTPQYIDLTFRGYINWKGKLVIKNVDSTKTSNEVRFED